MASKWWLIGQPGQHMTDLSAWPRYYVCDTEADLPAAIPGGLALDLATGTLHKGTAGGWIVVGAGAVSAEDITDATAVGIALLTAADAAAGRTVIGAGTSSFSGAYDDLSGKPALFSGAYADLSGKPTLGDAAAKNTGTSAGTVAAGDHTHSGGSDPWTYLRLPGDFTISTTAAGDVTNGGVLLGFTPAANTRYEFVGRLMVRTATATVGPRPGIAWPTGMTDGVAFIQQTSSATANVFANGNISAAVLAPVGGVPTTTGSWPALIEGMAIAGASPSGAIRVQLASETAGTVVRVVAGSFFKYRTIP